MKRLFTFASALFVSVALASCSASDISGKTSCENGLGKSFSASADITIDKLQAEGEIKRFGDGEWQINFTSPNTLSGVELTFSEGNVTASYKGLSFSVPKSAVPVKSMLINLIDAVDENARSEELKGSENGELLEIKGSLEGGDYTLTVDGEGQLNMFEMPNNSLKMSFSDFRAITLPTTDSAETTAEQSDTTDIQQ